MRRFPRSSVVQLILISFGVVALPLIGALIWATSAVDRLAGRSQQALFEVAETMRLSQLLAEQAADLERNARQYQILGDAELRAVFDERARALDDTARALVTLPLGQHLRVEIGRALAARGRLQQALPGPRPNAAVALPAADDGRLEAAAAELRAHVRAVQQASDAQAQAEVDHMREAAAALQRRLMLQGAAVVPAAIVIALIATLLIARPIRQIDHAIRRMGAAEFAAPIAVRGPQDLEQLGELLEWLRLRLLDLEQQKIRFLRHISHELKTPLTSLREGTELLRDQVVGELTPAQSEVAEILRDNSLQLQRLIDDLLNFSMAQAAPAATGLAPVALDGVVRAVLKEHTLTLRVRRLDLQLELIPALVLGDADKLRVVVDNLVSNAVKFSPDRGRLRVSLRAEAGQAVLDVMDDGPGIEPDDRVRVFEAFYQGRAAPRGHVKGSGLGLAIVQENVRLHQGQVSALPAGQGAHLQVRLPLIERAT